MKPVVDWFIPVDYIPAKTFYLFAKSFSGYEAGSEHIRYPLASPNRNPEHTEKKFLSNLKYFKHKEPFHIINISLIPPIIRFIVFFLRHFLFIFRINGRRYEKIQTGL
jgi:hypothetical protein